jgi:hypothetical protein
MSHEVECSCGAVLRGGTGELLLEAVERHAIELHAEPTWRRGPTLADLRAQVSALGARVERLEALRASIHGSSIAERGEAC